MLKWVGRSKSARLARVCVSFFALVLAPAGAVQAQPAAPSDGMFEATLCNFGGEPVAIAVVGRTAAGGPWMRRGWARVPDAQCLGIGRYVQGHFYYYIKYDSGVALGGGDQSPSYCIKKASSDELLQSGPCATNEEGLKFVDITVPGPTLQLGPIYGQSPEEAKLPSVSAGVSDSQALYDACEQGWNGNDWKKKPDPKAMVAGLKRDAKGVRSTICYLVWSQPDLPVGIFNAMAECQKDGSTCYEFARGASLLPWAWKEYQDIKTGRRK